MPVSTLSKGYKLPTSPTYGDEFFPALETDITLMNNHTHDGSDGARIAATTQTVSSGSWGSDLGGGTYRQLITLTSSLQYDSVRIEVRRSTGEMVYQTIERVSASTMYIYTNDNTLSYTISYV